MATQISTASRKGPGPLAGRARGRDANGNGKQRRAGDLRIAADEQLGMTLGWFSIGLGLVEIFAPRALGKMIGAGRYSSLLPVLGAREIASGIGILCQERPATALWSRVAGDGMDLAFLAAAAHDRRAEPARLAAAAIAVAGVAALDLLCSERVSGLPLAKQPRGPEFSGVQLRYAVTINKPAAELYAAWRKFENLPQWMRHLESVRETGEKTTHWVAKGPAGMTVEWDAETVADVADHRIAWRSQEGSQVDTAGSVEFVAAPGNRGTEIRIELTYNPPGGRMGAAIAALFGSAPEQEIQEDLRRFKSTMETGEVPRADERVRGRCASCR